MAGEAVFSPVLNFKASHSHLLAREDNPGGWDLEFLFPFSYSDAIRSKSLYDFSRLAKIGLFFSISSFKSPLS